MEDRQIAGQTVYVNFAAEIIPQTVETLMQALANLSEHKPKTIYLAFSTPGGEVQSGITLYNFLCGLSVDLVMHNSGGVNSMGNAIFLAADKRYACSTATFMFHGVGTVLQQETRLEEKQLREILDGITADQARISDIICDRTSITQDKVKKLFREANTITAKLALNFGIIHEIRELRFPVGAPVLSFVFQR